MMNLDLHFESPTRIIEGMRLIKSPAELAIMRHAGGISGEAFVEVLLG